MTSAWWREAGRAPERGECVGVEDLDSRLIGLAAVSGAAVLANYLFWTVGAPIVLQFLAVAALAAALVYFVVKPPVSRDWPIKLLLVSLVLISLGSPSAAWDARSIWLFHAKRIFVEGSLYAQLDGYAEWSHNDYPVLVPALAASLAKMVRHWNEVFPKLSSVLALAPALFLLAAPLRSGLQQLMLCWLLLFVCDWFLINGYMDGIVAAYFTAASLPIAVLASPEPAPGNDAARRRRLLILAGIVFALLSLLKNEGLPALGSLILAALLTKLAVPPARSTAAMVAVTLVAVVPLIAWKIVCATHDIGNYLAASNLSGQFAARAHSIAAWREILSHLLGRGAFLLPFALFLYAAVASGQRRVCAFVLLSALTYFAVLFVVYLATPLDLVEHLATSAQRTVMPIALILGYYFVVFVPRQAPAASA